MKVRARETRCRGLAEPRHASPSPTSRCTARTASVVELGGIADRYRAMDHLGRAGPRGRDAPKAERQPQIAWRPAGQACALTLAESYALHAPLDQGDLPGQLTRNVPCADATGRGLRTLWRRWFIAGAGVEPA